jgi:hypothetical protein
MNLFLISNGSPETYPDNKLTNFKNKLPTVFEFPENENWCMAVESIGFSTNFRNIDLPKNPDVPSFILSNCQLDVPRCDPMVRLGAGGKFLYSNDESDECQIKLAFKYEENEDGQGCFWHFFRFEDKYYTFEDMEAFFLKVRMQNLGAEIGLDATQRFSIYNSENLNLGKDLWFLASESMMSTFNIPKTNPLEVSTDYFKKVGFGQYDLVRRYYSFNDSRSNIYDTIHNEKPYITYYKGEKYYAFRLKSPNVKVLDEEGNIRRSGKEINLYGCKQNKISHPEKTFPKLVKVVSEDVKQQVFNSEYSKDLLCFCPDFQKEDKYFFHEFENRQYVPISNSIITDLNIKLLDNSNQYLQLLKGVPTIVKLDLKKMNSDDKFFNVRLTSDKSVSFPNNTKSTFKVKLPNTLSLERTWKVCLTSISHPNIFKTFLDDINSRKILIKHAGSIVHQYVLENTSYTKESFVRQLNKLFKESLVGEVKLNKFNQLIITFLQEEVEILASNYFFNIIGFNGTLDETKGFTRVKINEAEGVLDRYNSETQTSEHEWLLTLPLDINFLRPDYMIAYTNIVSPSIIGGLYSKILRVIPIKNSGEADYVVSEFHHKEYLELQNTEINEIEIELRAHDGSLVDFGLDQNVILNLEFRHQN